MIFCYDTIKVFKQYRRKEKHVLSRNSMAVDERSVKAFSGVFRWPQAKVLACYSLLIVLANSCGLTEGEQIAWRNCWGKNDKPASSACGSGAMKRRRKVESNGRRWLSPSVLPRGFPGSSHCGLPTISNWCWCSMPPRWPIGLWSSLEAGSCAVVRFPWPGTSSEQESREPISRAGDTCSICCTKRFPLTGRSWSWQTGDSMPSGTTFAS